MQRRAVRWIAVAVLSVGAARGAVAQETPPPSPTPEAQEPTPLPTEPTPQEPTPSPQEPTPAEPTPAEPTTAPAQTPIVPPVPVDPRTVQPRFELLDVTKNPFPPRPLTALGYPVILTPKALGYLAAYPTVRLGRDGRFGTRINMDPVLGLDNYEVGAPDIHIDVQTDLGGWSNILRFEFRDSMFRGTRAIRTTIEYDRTTFAQGTVLEGVFAIQDVELKLIQRLGDWGPIEIWATLGGHYARTYTRLRDPAGARRESNGLEVPQLVMGGRLAWTPVPWFSAFGELDGMAWKVRGIRSATVRGALGVEWRLGGGWGVVLDWSASYFEAVRGGSNRDELEYLAFGPRLAILAGL